MPMCIMLERRTEIIGGGLALRLLQPQFGTYFYLRLRSFSESSAPGAKPTPGHEFRSVLTLAIERCQEGKLFREILFMGQKIDIEKSP